MLSKTEACPLSTTDKRQNLPIIQPHAKGKAGYHLLNPPLGGFNPLFCICNPNSPAEVTATALSSQLHGYHSAPNVLIYQIKLDTV